MTTAAVEPQEARLISTKEGQAGSSKLYYIDYAVQRPEDPEERMFISAVSLGFNGRQACRLGRPVFPADRFRILHSTYFDRTYEPLLHWVASQHGPYRRLLSAEHTCS